MAKAKRLGGALGRQQQLGQVRGIDQAGRALDAPMTPDTGDMRQVPIDEVRIDPNNPRRMQLDWETVRQDLETIADDRLRHEVEDIRGLSATIKKVGQRSPCEVVRDGSIYRIVFGERRYWASRLAEKSTIKVIVLREAPENVPLVQLIENIQHKQLPIYETILNIRSVIERESDIGKPIKDATDLIDRTGLARASAYRYWKYVDIPKDVEDALEQRAINSHDELTALLKHTTVKARREALARLKAGGNLNTPSNPSPRVASPRARGRPRKVALGSTAQTEVVKLLFEALGDVKSQRPKNWDDPVLVSRAWKDLLSELENRVRHGQT